MSEESIECQFCGSGKVEVGTHWDVPGGYVRCECGAMMQKVGGTLEDAVRAWNQRVIREENVAWENWNYAILEEQRRRFFAASEIEKLEEEWKEKYAALKRSEGGEE